MEMHQLRYFCAVARTGSIRKAAELLHISPAALSKSVGILERGLGAKLILPSGRGIVISDTGSRLAARVEPILADLDGIGKEILGESQTVRALRIVSFEVFTTWLMGPLVETHFVKTPLLVHEMLPGQMEAAIEENLADIGITYLPIPSPKVDHLKVATLEMGVYGRRDVFSKAPFESLPFAVPISPVSGSPNKVRGLDGWPDDKVHREIAYRVTLMETAMELCRKGIAVAYLPTPVVKYHNQTVREKFALYPLSCPKIPASTIRQEVFLVKRKSDLEGQMFKRFAAALRSVCK